METNIQSPAVNVEQIAFPAEFDETLQLESTLKLIRTGRNYTLQNRNKIYFSTHDLVIIAILGVMGGFISGLIPFSLLVKTWFPFVGGTQMVSGHHILWFVIVYGITKKKLAIILTAIMKGFIMLLLGAEWGALEIAISVYEALFTIVGFYIMEKFNEGTTSFGWGMAAGLGNLSQVPFFWILSGKIYVLHISLFIMAMMFAFASGVIVAGLLGKKITELLEKAGVI
jgi:hypothetical protein